jgi:hypothetical protein
MTVFKPFHHYMVSEHGEIVGNHGKLTPAPDKDGYARISLRLEKGKATKIHVHRIVYMAFHGEIPKNMVCCHIDSNIKNNHYTNLRIDTQKGNIRDKLKNGTWQAGNNHPKTIYQDNDILKIQNAIKDNPELQLRHFEEMLKPFPRHLIFDVMRGKRKTREQRINDAERLSI